MFFKTSLVCLFFSLVVLAQDKAGNLPEWADLQNKILFLEAKVKTNQTNLQKMIEEKQKLPADSPRVNEIVKEMVSTHKDLEKAIEDYNKQNAVLRFRFPERLGKQSDKKQKYEIKSLTDMEKDMSVDGRLNRNMQLMRTQYKSETGQPQAEPTPIEKKEPPKQEVIIIRK